MRAQLAVSSLILFGVVLIGFGFVKLPYVALNKDTVVVQTSSTTAAEVEEVVVTTVQTTSTQDTSTTVVNNVATTTIYTETTKTIYFTMGVETTVVETRYSDLSFMAFMGSFLVFVGILLMALTLKAMPKPTDKPKIPE
jgi:hypothetical protein